MIGVGSALISLFLALVCYSLTLTAKRADENLLMICEQNQKIEEEKGKQEMESKRDILRVIEKEIKNILEIIDKRIIENINIKTHKVGADDMKNEKRKQAIYEYKEKKTTGGVYKITNTESKKSLIKGEIDLASMQNRFNFSVKTNSCLNLKLRNDWNKYGANSFTFEILEEVEMKSEMDRRQFKKQLDELADKYSEKMNEDELY